MVKGQRINNKGINLIFRYHFNRLNLSVNDISILFKLSNPTVTELLKNHYKMTLNQLVLLAGRLGIEYLELVYMLHYNKPKLTTEDKQTLSSIITKHKPTE